MPVGRDCAGNMLESIVRRVAAALSRLRTVLPIHPHDMSTEAGRSAERHRRVGLSAMASALAKVISVSTALISVPLTLHYLGPERYGLWMTISSLVAILAFADLGIGNGMLNAIAAANGRDDRAGIQVYVSSGFFVLSVVAALMLLTFAAVYPIVDWAAIFNVKTDLARSEVGPAAAVFVACFALAIPVAIVQRVQMGMQRGFLASLWQCLSSVLGLAGVLVAIWLEAGLPWLVLAYFGAPLVASALNSWLFFGRMQPELAPSRVAVSRTAARTLLRTGGLFLVLQVVAAVAYASDSLVIAQLLGAAAVSDFAVPERMFSLITLLLAMVLAPLWPAYGEAIVRGDSHWVRKTLTRSVGTAVAVAAVLSACLVLAAPGLLFAWVGNAVAPSLLLLVALGVWKTVEAGGSALAVFLNGAQIVRAQIVMAVLTAGSALLLKMTLVPRIGVSGVVWATIASYLVFTGIPSILLLPRILRSLSGKATLQ